MARIAGVETPDAGLLTRLFYFLTRRKLGRVVLPIKIAAHQPPVLRGHAAMEIAQQAARSLDPALKTLLQVYVATLIGCPF